MEIVAQLVCSKIVGGGIGFGKLCDFNLALLCKDAWSLVNNPSTLATKILKARYYPNSSFLEAQKGTNPSFIWSSIFETQAIIWNNCRWRVGDGISISIWKDKWLPNDVNAYVVSTHFPYLEQATVDSIMNE